MTSFYDLTIGQQVELHRILAAAGFTAEVVERIIKQPELAAMMIAALNTPPEQTWKAYRRATAPSWYVQPERQLARMRELNATCQWGLTEADFQSVATIPTLELGEGEVLLLAATLPKSGRQSSLVRTLTGLWAAAEAPAGYRKVTYWYPTANQVQLVPGYKLPSAGLRWVVFVPNANTGKSPKSLWDDGVRNLATVETLSALLMFPDWPKAWGTGGDKRPNLAALQSGAGWSESPYLHRWDDNQEFNLHSSWADNDVSSWASPQVREC